MQQIWLRDLKFLLFYSSCLPCSVRDLTNIACFLSPDFVGPGHCTIPCADGHGDYDDKFDGTGETEAIDVCKFGWWVYCCTRFGDIILIWWCYINIMVVCIVVAKPCCVITIRSYALSVK
jgi:hypothetical protein